MPTDDSRLRIVLIPGVFVERTNMLQSVQEVLSTMQAIEEESKPVSNKLFYPEIYLPCFKVDVQSKELPEFKGV